jgi:hypothetical protein
VAEPPRIYANRLQISAGERDAVIGADYIHPAFVGDDTAKGERVVELVIPREALGELRRLLDAELGG